MLNESSYYLRVSLEFRETDEWNLDQNSFAYFITKGLNFIQLSHF